MDFPLQLSIPELFLVHSCFREILIYLAYEKDQFRAVVGPVMILQFLETEVNCRSPRGDSHIRELTSAGLS